MSPAKFYKVKLNQNSIFKTYFTHEYVIPIFITLSTLFSIFYLDAYTIHIRVFVNLIIFLSSTLILSTRIDEQSIYELLPRLILYLIRKKHVQL